MTARPERPIGSHASEQDAVEELLVTLRGSETLEMLGVTSEELELAREDSDLLETLRITHDLLLALRDGGVLGSFMQLQKSDRANFLRWIASTDGRELRVRRTGIFINALEESPLGEPSFLDGSEKRIAGSVQMISEPKREVDVRDR